MSHAQEASEHLHDALIQAFHKLSICICTVQSILHVTSTTRMHDKVAPKQAQVACIRKNTSKQLCSKARWTLHNHTEQNLQRNYLVNLSVRVADSRLVHCSAGIWERAGFCSIFDNAQIHLLLSGLIIGWNDSSFPFSVHGGLCLKTFNLLDTCQRKRPGKRSISIATRLVFSSLFVSPALATNQAQFLLGELETVHWWFFFFNRCSRIMLPLPLLWRKGGHLKGEGTLYSLYCCTV